MKIKNISPTIMTLIILSVIGVLTFIPIQKFFLELKFSEFQSEYVSLIIKMFFLFLSSYVLINKLRLRASSGISSNYKWKHKLLNLIPFYLVIIGLISILNINFSNIHLSNLSLLLIGCLVVGFGEEFTFRGLLQSIFLRKYHDRKYGLFLGVFIPALSFGLFHLINLRTNEQALPVLIQVVFATFIGFFFGALLLKTNKLIPLAITHGLINFFFSFQQLPNIAINSSSAETGATLGSIIICLPLFIAGILILKKVNKEKLHEKLQMNIKLTA